MRVEVRWRKNHGFAAMAVCSEAVAQGDSQDRAVGALIKLLEPDVDAVRDECGARLA